MIESPKIPRNKHGSFGIESDKGRSRWWFCGTELREAFDLPKGTQAVQFRAFTEPAPGRWEVYIGTQDSVRVWRTRYEGEGEAKTYFVDDDTEKDIFQLIGRRRKTWWVEVYYWA